ncbi:MAG: flagellar biosynthesis protein FliP [Frankiaceae bacterium]|nr:flagellar biosynthesis protein FliP [Frankiaceae bacterium]
MLSRRRPQLVLLGFLAGFLLLCGAAPAVAASAPRYITAAASNETTLVAATAPAPAAPAAPKTPAKPNPETGDPVKNVIDDVNSGSASPLTIVLLLGVISLVPALLMMVTAFTRIVIVLGFTRSALGTQQIPPNQVIIGLALFLTLFVMAPTFSQVNAEAVQPLLKGKIETSVAFEKAQEPFKTFMLKQVREKDLGLFIKLSNKPAPKNRADISIATLVPAYVLSELRTAFLIGFVIFLPFLVIDFVVSAALSSMGMMMLPPVLISLPFKLLLFVAADGWYLVVSSLVQSFHA